jgi:hypothetical protein
MYEDLVARGWISEELETFLNKKLSPAQAVTEDLAASRINWELLAIYVHRFKPFLETASATSQLQKEARSIAVYADLYTKLMERGAGETDADYNDIHDYIVELTFGLDHAFSGLPPDKRGSLTYRKGFTLMERVLRRAERTRT